MWESSSNRWARHGVCALMILTSASLRSDGSRASIEIDLEFKMAELSDRELALELERIRKRNKELQLLLERRRIDTFRERERQRRELELTPEVQDR